VAAVSSLPPLATRMLIKLAYSSFQGGAGGCQQIAKFVGDG